MTGVECRIEGLCGATGDRAVVLTPAGTGAIAVVRLVGPGVGGFLERHFSRTAREGRCVHGELREGEQIIDDPVVVISDGGRMADVNLHGGPWVIAAVMELARREGFDIEPSGDDALPDVALDAETPIEREMLAHLPKAKTPEALRILMAQPAAWASLGPDLSIERIDAILGDRSLWWLLHPPRVAIVGAANVGKSTLANQLFAQEHSITADLPGTTRDWVGETANLDGLPILLVDTPGLRLTNDPIEQAAIDRSSAVIASADATVLVLDASRPLDAEQRALLDRFPSAIRVLNKIDRAMAWAGAMPEAIRTVATTGAGVDELRGALRDRFDCRDFAPNRPRWWTQRQRDLLVAAKGDPAVLRDVVRGT